MADELTLIYNGKRISGGGSGQSVPAEETVRSATADEYNAMTEAQKAGLWAVSGMTPDGDIPVKDNVYSTEEVRIGTWLGKPLYRRLYNFTTPATVNQQLFCFKMSDDANIKVVSWRGYMAAGNGTLLSVDNNACHVFITASLDVGMDVNRSDLLSCSAYMWIEYTKTTDSEVTLNE